MDSIELTDIAAFVAVAEVLSFRKAAQLRGGSASSLSDAVRRLEAAMGTPLMRRTTRSVSLTEAGQQVLLRVRPALAEIWAAADTVKSSLDEPKGTLRLNVPTIAARSFLPSLINRFLANHPSIHLEVVVDDNFSDVLASGFDAGIRYVESLARDMVAIPIGPPRQRFVAAASRSYLLERGVPGHPDELIHHDLIGHRFLSGAVFAWVFEKEGKTIKIRPDGRLISSSIRLQLSAVRAGLGITYLFEEDIGPDIARGEVVPVLSDWWDAFPGPSLYFSGHGPMSNLLRVFVDFVKNEYRERHHV
jgi:DNA-binding transcriptional LysR family regulator